MKTILFQFLLVLSSCINPIKAGLFRALHGWGGTSEPPPPPPLPLLLIGKYLDHETWHTYRATYSVQIFVTIFLPMSAFFLLRHFPLKTQIFSKIFFFNIFKFIKEKNDFFLIFIFWSIPSTKKVVTMAILGK